MKMRKAKGSSSLMETIISVIVLVGLTIGSKNTGPIISFVLTVAQYTVFAGVIGYFLYKIYIGWKNEEISKSTIYINIGALILLLVGFWFIFPVIANEIVYQGIFLHLPHVIIASIGLGIAYFTYLYMSKIQARWSLAFVYGFLSLIVTVGGPLGMSFITDWKIAENNVYKKRDSIVKVDVNAINYTPRQIAFKELIGGFNSSEYQIMDKLTNTVKLQNGSLGYISPIIPDGVVNQYIQSNPGYMVYNDSLNTSEENRIQRVNQFQEYGEEMEWLDNIWRQLYSADMFSAYTNIIYLQLDKKNPEKRVAVAPKIKYEWKFPFILVPYWAGVTLVHSDGKVETLSVDEAMADSRLKNTRIFPSALAEKYAEVQIYDKGFMEAFYKREGKISIPELPGTTQMPFYTPADDGNDYYITMTVPDGNSDAMFKIFYINAYTGEKTVYDFGSESRLFGPVAALEKAKSIPGYKWIEDDDKNEDGNFRIIEPSYLTKGDKIYLKFSITPRSYRGVTSNVVVDLSKRTFKEYKSREEFFAWFLDNQEQTGIAKKEVDKFQLGLSLIKKGKEMIDKGEQILIDYKKQK